ncbi:MAG TPA: tRNA preQ1(34) S-adenosylmethionine ribosyltransferase-isomerase QueA [Firmicutes bacterium]|nr:tRNA preQ1(34) S-adenosylmethionine ribosyltransferase-isomerase QueA [Bacillota bacterium]
MKVADFDYYLPEELIAQEPVEPRDASRLLVVHRKTGQLEHRVFRDIVEYLLPGDVLIINDTKVIPARLYGRKKDTGGQVELLLLRRINRDLWETLVRPGRRVRPGTWLEFGDGRLLAEVEDATPAGGRIVRFVYEGVFETILDELGQMPLPPYIHKELADRNRYQTVYAREEGSAAAPTAGLHFTPGLLDKIKEKGVAIHPITLHVGLGTFRPVKVEEVAEHKMHSEYYSISEETANAIAAAKEAGGKVIAVGTTTTRTLEAAAHKHGRVTADSGWTDIFIYPGFQFRVVDALITNFHLPRSTLLMLVSALAGRDLILHAYRVAVERRYRFFSFGDAMLIL